MQPFHLAFPVTSLAKARAFYGELLGCPEGRSSDEWVDFNFYGHQIVAHLSPNQAGHHATNEVDSHNVPVRHFGMVAAHLEMHRARATGGGFAEGLTHQVRDAIDGINMCIELRRLLNELSIDGVLHLSFNGNRDGFGHFIAGDHPRPCFSQISFRHVFRF